MEEEPDSPLDAPQIGAGHVIRKVSNAARKVSDGVRKMSGEALKKMRSPRRKLSGADVHDLLFGDNDSGDGGGNGGGSGGDGNRYSPFVPDEEHPSSSSIGGSVALCLKLAVALLIGATAVVLMIGRYVEGVREQGQTVPVGGERHRGSGVADTAAAAGGAAVTAVASDGTDAMHARLLADQRAVHGAGGAVQLSCKSTGKMHLVGALQPGQSCLVHCAPGCVSSDWVARHEHTVWGGVNGGAYLDASLVCVAAKHATGEDGGQFELKVVSEAEAAASSFASSTMFGVHSAEHGSAGRAFTLELQQTAKEVEAARRVAAERAITDQQEVPAPVLRAHLQALLANVPPASCLMRFFASAVGKLPPHEATIADFGRLDAMHGLDRGLQLPSRGYLTAVLLETVLREALAADHDEQPGDAEHQDEQPDADHLRPRQHSLHHAAASGGSSDMSRWVKLERAAFTAMDLDSNGQLVVEEYMGGFEAFERALNLIMVEADNDPKDRKISGKELRAMTRDQVQPTMLAFYDHVSHAPRLQDHGEELRRI